MSFVSTYIPHPGDMAAGSGDAVTATGGSDANDTSESFGLVGRGFKGFPKNALVFRFDTQDPETGDPIQLDRADVLGYRLDLVVSHSAVVHQSFGFFEVGLMAPDKAWRKPGTAFSAAGGYATRFSLPHPTDGSDVIDIGELWDWRFLQHTQTFLYSAAATAGKSLSIGEGSLGPDPSGDFQYATTDGVRELGHYFADAGFRVYDVLGIVIDNAQTPNATEGVAFHLSTSAFTPRLTLEWERRSTPVIAEPRAGMRVRAEESNAGNRVLSSGDQARLRVGATGSAGPRVTTARDEAAMRVQAPYSRAWGGKAP